MFIYKMIFRIHGLPYDRVEFLHHADTVLSLMRSQGQIVSESDVFIFQEDHAYIHILCPEKESIRSACNSIFANEFLSRYKDDFEVEFKFIDQYYDYQNGDISTSNSLILRWSGDSPIRSGDNHQIVPLYKLPYTYNDDSYHNLNSWVSDYQAIYRLWFSGALGERKFHNYMSVITSPLNKNGLLLRDLIESLTGKKCYYYLFNYASKKQKDKCPSCGKDWQLKEMLFDEYDLKCDDCRLLSNTAK